MSTFLLIVIAATLALATIVATAFVSPLHVPQSSFAAQYPHHNIVISGRRRRRLLYSPSSPTTCATTHRSRQQLLFSLNRKHDDEDKNINSSETVDTNNPTDDLLHKARLLREEISAIESAKLQAQNKKDAQIQERLAAQETIRHQNEQKRLRYSAVIPILKDMGEEVMERVDFPPRVKGKNSYIVALQAPLPLGLILSEESSVPGLICVDSLSPDGNGSNAGVKEGDILRAVSACQVTMESPTWQLLAGGIGRPKTKRFMCVVDGRPLEEVLDAVGSNRMDASGRDVWLVLERIE